MLRSIKTVKKKITAILSLALVLSLLLGMNAFALNDQTPAYKAQLAFGDDGKFTILQLADIQDIFLMFPIVKDFVKDIVPATNPDLIVLTGDNFSGGSCNTGIHAVDTLLVKSAIDQYMSVLEGYGIPVAVVFGNHDAETTVNKEEQMAIYSTYDCCIGFDEGSGIDGCGNYNVPIYSANDPGKLAYNLWMMDSNMYDDVNGGYDYVHQNQIDWYTGTSGELKAQNGGVPVPSMMFQHIIVPEIYDALLPVDAGTPGAIEHGGLYYVLNPANTKSGVMHECPCPSNTNGGQFNAVVSQGDVVAMVFGHDHVNTFDVAYRGVDLINTPGVNFASYGDENRGARVITLDENDTSTYETHLVTYKELYKDDAAAALRFTLYGSEFSVMDRLLAGMQYLLIKVTGVLDVFRAL
jgi:predicted phosphodiesterase